MIENKAQYYGAKVKPYCGAEASRSWKQLSGTFAVYAGLWFLSYGALSISVGLSLLLSCSASLFLVRLFMIQHDCGHGSYFKNKKTQDTVGFLLGVFTLTPYQYWRRTHAMHHSHSGNLDSEGEGEITTLTVEQYQSKGSFAKFGYRLYRNPMFLMTLGSFFQFAIKHRIPWDAPKSWKKEWRSVWGTNLCLLLMVIPTIAWMGLSSFLIVQLPITFCASTIGVFLFYVQHQYDDAYYRRRSDWDYYDAALQGSSHLVLPKPLQWLTANIGLHHIHHLNHNIPNYNLPACHAANPDLVSGKTIGFSDAWPLLKLALWDEPQQRLISFQDLERVSA